MKDSLEQLAELVAAAGLRITIDPLRNSSTGCSPSCRGWEPDASGWCPNHQAAIDSGDYCPTHRDVGGENCDLCQAVIKKLRKLV